MHGTVGIFASIQDARRGAQSAFAAVPSARLRIVTPEAAADEIDTLPADDAEQPGMGGTVGGAVGTAVGAAAASLVARAVGVAALAGHRGGALLGLGGGALAGDALEDALSAGVPRDEIVVYQEALKRGRSLVVAVVEDAEQADAARAAMTSAGARERERRARGLERRAARRSSRSRLVPSDGRSIAVDRQPNGALTGLHRPGTRRGSRRSTLCRRRGSAIG